MSCQHSSDYVSSSAQVCQNLGTLSPDLSTFQVPVMIVLWAKHSCVSPINFQILSFLRFYRHPSFASYSEATPTSSKLAFQCWASLADGSASTDSGWF